MTPMESIDQLNSQQRLAVLTTEGPLLISAGAGSGKTRVLTHRIAYLIEQKQVNPWNVLAITFTNKAANEMKERIHAIVGPDSESVWVSTFHSMCVRILRREAESIGYQRNFSIVDPSDQLTLLRQILKELNLDSKQFREKDLLWVIDQAKNKGQTSESFAQEAFSFIEEIQAKVFDLYQKKLKASNAMDFNDLILNTVKLLEENKAVRLYYQQKFQYIHVDEYQDTNNIQYQLVKLLAGMLNNLCVVGDSDQSIYGWRGANMENILHFEADYPNAKVILLEQNYRSTQMILKAANSVIQNNRNRKIKNLWSEKTGGDKIKFYNAYSDQDESRYVVQEIINLKDLDSFRNEDFAILYRTQAQSRSLEDQLLKANLPYRVVGGLQFYRRKEIQDTLAYLRLIDNPDDNLSFNRIVNVPKRGIGPGTLGKLADFASSKGVSWLAAIDLLDQSSLSPAIRRRLEQFNHLITDLKKQAEFLSVTDLVEQVWKLSGYTQALIDEGGLENQSRLENLEELASVTKEFDQAHSQIGHGDGLNRVALTKLPQEESQDSQLSDVDPSLNESDPHGLLRLFLTDLSLASDQQNEESGTAVTLMTMHAAKGLEFPVVFIVGMEEGLFPSYRAFENQEEMEEERRLAYVAMTRAQEKLYLTACKSRLLYGRYQNNALSRFVDEVDPALMQRVAEAFHSKGLVMDQQIGEHLNSVNRPRKASHHKVLKSKRSVRQRDSNEQTSSDIPVWQVGDQVDHRTWGKGTVVKLEGGQEDQILHVAFDQQGIKKLMAAFAPITKVIK